MLGGWREEAVVLWKHLQPGTGVEVKATAVFREALESDLFAATAAPGNGESDPEILSTLRGFLVSFGSNGLYCCSPRSLMVASQILLP